MMKTMNLILKLLNLKIKKYFFKFRKDDICHEIGCVNKSTINCNEKDVEEYLNNYRSATRWQTV